MKSKTLLSSCTLRHICLGKCTAAAVGTVALFLFHGFAESKSGGAGVTAQCKRSDENFI